MHSYLERLDDALPLPALVLAFWSLFWLLNGLDKFFNRPLFFGVTRDQSFVEYFARVNLSPPVALASLYACGIVEIMLGIAFVAAFAVKTPVLTQLCFKGSIIIFMIFTVADVLFGDRTELWEHGTYLILVLASVMTVKIERMAARREPATTPAGAAVRQVGFSDQAR